MRNQAVKAYDAYITQKKAVQLSGDLAAQTQEPAAKDYATGLLPAALVYDPWRSSDSHKSG